MSQLSTEEGHPSTCPLQTWDTLSPLCMCRCLLMSTVHSRVCYRDPSSLRHCLASPAAPALIPSWKGLVWGWQDGSQDWQLAEQGNHFRHHTGLGPSQIFSVTDPYESCGIPK